MRFYEHGGDIYGNRVVWLDFSVNTNPLGIPESVKHALSEHTVDCERYPDPYCRELRAALAARYGADDNMVLCGGGASDLILRVCACLKPRRVLTLAPTFSEYERSAALFGGETMGVHLSEAGGFALTSDILDEITQDTDMLFLCNPNNPTGCLAEPELLRRIADRCRELDVYLVLDECFLEFTDGASLIPLLGAYPKLLILRAFTKLYSMAGLRLGCLLCADAELLARIGSFGPAWSVSVPAQAAGLAALGEAGWEGRTRRLVKKERKFMTAALSGLGLTVFPGEANFLLVKSGTPLYAPLLERGILVRCCSNFAGLDERYFRIALKTRAENEALLRALSEVLYG